MNIVAALSKALRHTGSHLKAPRRCTSSATNVIISGRRKSNLDATTQANPGMHSVELDIADPVSIAAVAKKLIADYPALISYSAMAEDAHRRNQVALAP